MPLAGIELHFIHEEGRGPDPLPLLLSHGWPGSVFSLPGYTLSFRPGLPRFGVEEIADVFAELMTGVLGYRRFAAQGGDWGAFVTSRLGHAYPDRLHGIHLNLLAVRRDPNMVEHPTDEEKAFLGELQRWLEEETGYQWIQGTKPQTLRSAHRLPGGAGGLDRREVPHLE